MNEHAESEARELDDLKKRGKILPLHGLPVTIKVICAVKGFPHSMASKVEVPYKIATEDCTAVRRLREAGCIILGTTNMPEYGMAYETTNELYGTTLNPYSDEHSPGGSSGGESAALAAGLSPIGLGTDIAGSVRIPAHFAGCCSLKALRGRIPLSNGLSGPRNRLRVWGLMSRSINDIYTVLPHIQGPCPNDPDSYNIRPLSLAPVTDLSALRYVFFYDNKVLPPHEECIKAVDVVVDAINTDILTKANKPVAVLDTPDRIAETWNVWMGICGFTGGEWMPTIRDAIVENGFVKQTAPFLAKGDNAALQIQKTWVEASLYETSWLRFFEKYDVLICPVVSSPATRHGEGLDWKRISYCMQFNVFNCASAVVGPVAFTAEGLPLAVQVVSLNENLCMAVALFLQNRFKILAKTPANYQ